MPFITVYTPINERYHLLNQIFKSLLIQSNFDFQWLIIDYGESNFALSYFNKYKVESKFNVILYHLPSKGRFLATKFALENINTSYLVGLDGNFTLTSDAISVLIKEWRDINSTKLGYMIAEIRARAVDQNGNYIGQNSFNFEGIKKHIDSNWHSMVLVNKNYSEMLASWNREMFLRAVDFNRYKLFKNHYTELETTLFWSAIGRKYKTRYLKVALKVQESEFRNIPKEENNINAFVFQYYMLVENIGYIDLNPKYFLKIFLKLVQSIFKIITNRYFKFYIKW